MLKTLIENNIYITSGYGLSGVTFSPDGNTIAAGTMHGTIKLWQRDGTLIRTLGEPRKARVWHLSFSPDGNTIAASAESDLLELWEPNGRLIERLSIGRKIASISFSPDGNTIAVGTVNGEIGIVKLRE